MGRGFSPGSPYKIGMSHYWLCRWKRRLFSIRIPILQEIPITINMVGLWRGCRYESTFGGGRTTHGPYHGRRENGPGAGGRDDHPRVVAWVNSESVQSLVFPWEVGFRLLWVSRAFRMFNLRTFLIGGKSGADIAQERIKIKKAYLVIYSKMLSRFIKY